ncbi:MAG: GNAT family N-acetyltransferase [Pseudomonadota bacterium]
MNRSGPITSALSVSEIPVADVLPLLVAAGNASWRQYPAYAGVAAKAAGARSHYLLVSDGDQPVALANARIKPLPLVPAGLAVIAQGPVMLDDGAEMVAHVQAALRHYLVAGKGYNLRINPPVITDDIAVQRSAYEAIAGFAPLSGTGYETFIIDLAPDMEALRAGLNGKWRTDLRRGEKGDIRITRSADPEDFRLFQPLLQQLSHQKGFQAPQDAAFFADAAEMAGADERLLVHLAWHQDRLVGGHIGAYSGNMAVYLLGATNDEGRDLRASFRLQWAVIEHARSLGLSHYDLGGADEEDNPSVFRFKKRMGGVHYRGPEIQEARAAWPRGQIVELAETIYNRVRG